MARDKSENHVKGVKALSFPARAGEVMVYVFYDIVEDKIRTKIADACKDYGLERIQFSGFLGILSRNKREEFFLRLSRTMGKKAGRVLVQPVCEKDFQACREILNIAEDDDASEGE